MKRYEYLDTARGIGMMLVITAHSAGLSKYLIYYFIQLFFIISGYLYKPGNTYCENIKKKFLHLLVPYFSYSLVLLAFYFFAGRSPAETAHSALGILYSRYCLYRLTKTPVEENIFFFDIANGGFWYLTAFFTSSVIYHLLIDKCLKNRCFLYFSMIGLTIITMALAELPVLLPWSIDIAFAGALFMIIGTFLSKNNYFDKPCNYKQISVIFIFYMILTTINPGINTSAREYGIYGRWSVPFFILIGISGSIICIWIAVFIHKMRIGKLLSYIGKHTIILLAFHILILELFEIIAKKYITVEGFTGFAFVVYHSIRITFSVCISLLIGEIIHRGKHLIFKTKKEVQRI